MTLTVARFLLKHGAFLLLTLFVVSFLVFTLNEFSPGDVARKVLGAYATQEQVDILTREMGLNRPVLVRYVEFLGRLAAGDLGTSTRFKVPVKDIIWNRLANTAFLAALAFACIVPLSMLLGIVAISLLFGPAAVIFAAPIVVVVFVAVKVLYVRDTLGEDTEIPGESA